MLLCRWSDEKRHLHVVASLGDVELSAFCRVLSANENFFVLTIGKDKGDMLNFRLDGWSFEFGEPPSEHNDLINGPTIESSICGARNGLIIRIYLLALGGHLKTGR